jgi:hypothetical protein
MKTSLYLWEYLTQFCLEWEIFQTEIKTHILFHTIITVHFYELN